MTTSPSSIRHTASSAVPQHIRIAQTPADWHLAHSLLEQEHLLGAGREAGDRLCQFVLEEDRIVAVLIWCAAAWHIQDRDTMIGWDPVTRSQRLKLVVQLRRFLVPEKTRRPNLASQCLGFALRELPGAWHAEHGYRPLIAESFSDPESHHGTVYKVTNWICAGDTKGFSQDHTDYYLPNGRPKKLWLKPLVKNACTLLCAPELPEDSKAGLTHGGGTRSPLKVAQLKTLRDAFALAKEKAPCIIFIDEIDAIGTKRFDSELSGDREVQRTMLELLNQLDGFASSDDVKVRGAGRWCWLYQCYANYFALVVRLSLALFIIL
jgi:hypothetical protein